MNQPELSSAPPPRSSGGGPLKWILLGCGGIVFLGVAFFALSGYFLYKSFNTDPSKAEAVAKEIVSFETPAGYKGIFSMSMMGVKSAALAAGEGKDSNAGMIMLYQFPAGTQSREQLEKQMKDNLEKQGHTTEASESKAAETFKVRGKDVSSQVTTVTNKNSSGRMTQYMIQLEGDKGKMIAIMIMGPEKTVDHAWVQKFLDTVK